MPKQPHTTNPRPAPKRVLVETGQHQSQCTVYSIPAPIAARVIPTGYYGWDDCNTTSHVVDDPSAIRRKRARAQQVDDLADAWAAIRGYPLPDNETAR